MFFGAASRVVAEVRRNLAAAFGDLRHLIPDFANVQGINGPALANFERLQRLAASDGVALAFAAMPPAVADLLADLSRLAGAAVHVAAMLDAALSWREAAVLAGWVPPRCATRCRAPLATERPAAHRIYHPSLSPFMGRHVISPGPLRSRFHGESCWWTLFVSVTLSQRGLSEAIIRPSRRSAESSDTSASEHVADGSERPRCAQSGNPFRWIALASAAIIPILASR